MYTKVVRELLRSLFGEAKKKLNHKLTPEEIRFIIVVAMLTSFLAIWFIAVNFGDDLNLSPVFSSSRTRVVNPQGVLSGTPITTPYNLVASDGNEQIILGWSAPTGGIGGGYYEVYRSITSNVAVNGVLIGRTIADETHFVDTQATIGQTFWYGVRVNGNNFISDVEQGSVSSTTGMRWSYETTDVIESLSFGDHGTKLFWSSSLGNNIHARLFSTIDSNPPTPIFTKDTATILSYNSIINVAAARNADVYGDVAFAVGSGSVYPHLRTYTSSIQPVFNYTSIANTNVYGNGLWISDDGTRNIAFLPTNSTDYFSRIITFDSFGTILNEVVTTQLPSMMSSSNRFDFSGDGSRIAFTTLISRREVVDSITGSLVFDDAWGGPSAFQDITINYDGSIMASAHTVDPVIRIENLNSGLESVIYLPATNPNLDLHYGRIAISDDGMRLAYAYSDIDGLGNDLSKRGGALLWDISSPQDPILLVNYLFEAPATPYQESMVEIKITPDGNRFVYGTRGDGTSSINDKQIKVFEAGQNNPIAEFNLPLGNNGAEITGSSPYDVDISPDGTKIAVAVKNGHWTSGNAFKEVNLYDVA
ncbi:hypothetical protein HN604_00590 [archaeon]|nr:hypothetical protein [archaeon]MBT6182537.1 hypothetical protein [archaeon]MBT6606742.1 hypothetical protein [archaeon]MBT7251300.1 hypothetical protein [archaeon]MBT7660563.1 hypothetical protein [archaeon]